MPLPVEPARGKVILLTGANRGIGLTTALELLERGAIVVAGMRRPEKGPKLPGGATIVELEMTSAPSCESFVQRALAQHGRIDGLINNAAILLGRRAPISELKEEDLRQAVEVNLIGPFRLCQLVIPHMLARGHGRIVNVSSGLGAISDMGRGSASYRLTKLALNGLTRILSAELGEESGVKINSICPGWVKTDMGAEGAVREPADAAREIADLVSIARDGPSGGFFRHGEPIAW